MKNVYHDTEHTEHPHSLTLTLDTDNSDAPAVVRYYHFGTGQKYQARYHMAVLDKKVLARMVFGNEIKVTAEWKLYAGQVEWLRKFRNLVELVYHAAEVDDEGTREDYDMARLQFEIHACQEAVSSLQGECREYPRGYGLLTRRELHTK